ncbi:MAG TPA: hypothetical protein VFB99_21505 [Vicinamibacterales bacterium]|nr:hypothetical protein [Vicinamibacterales bacterium]
MHWTYATEGEARRAISAIDLCLGPTEEVRLPDGRLETRPRRPWFRDPIPLRDGTFAIPCKARLASIGDTAVRVNGTDVRVRRTDEAVTITDADRADVDPEVTETRVR